MAALKNTTKEGISDAPPLNLGRGLSAPLKKEEGGGNGLQVNLLSCLGYAGKNREKKGVLLGARLRGRTATQRSEKGSQKVLGRVLGKGSGEGFSEGF